MVKMETTFYEDHGYQPVSRPRRNLTLDLNNGPRRSKQSHMTGMNQITPGNIPMSIEETLTSELNTPDIDNLIRNVRPNSLSPVTPTTTERVLADASSTKDVTDEQASFAKGFEDALGNLQNSDSSSQGLNSAPTYMSLESYPTKTFFQSSMIAVKDEPQTVPNISSASPPMPVDMEAQEQLKLERKRQRNRLAASKCRRKKLERIHKLELKVQSLKSENNELTLIAKKLKDQVCDLKRLVLEHNNSGCQILQPVLGHA